MALLVALGALMTLTIIGTSVAYYTSSGTRDAARSKSSGVAFQLAEAGLHEALAVLSNQPTNDPTNPTLLATRTSPYSTGNVTWAGTYDSANAKWTITSTGTVTNPAGLGVPPSESSRSISAKVPVRPVTTQTSTSQAWNYIFSYGTGDPDGCDMDTTSSVSIETRIIVAGNLCIKDSSTIEGSGTEVEVGGQVKLFGSASIGRNGSNAVAKVNAAGGCKYESGSLGTCNTSRKVWTSSTSSTPALQAAPSPDWNYWYSKAAPGPVTNCTGANRSGTPPTFDNDTSRNRSAPAANLTPSSSYTCKVYLGTDLLGEISWNNNSSGTGAKTLTVRGTIFIDGNVQITQASQYDGQATIYASGSFYMVSGNMCAVRVSVGGDCNWTTGGGGWNPNDELLAIVTNGAGGFSGSVEADTTVKLDSSVKWQGAIYGGPYKARLLSSIRFAGPVIADEVYVDSSLQTEPFSTIVTSPTGLPGNTSLYAKPDKLELFSG
jgi:Tfp pilus assembly protein PilX